MNRTQGTPSTLFDKLWRSHEVVTREDGATLLWVDRHFVHEGSFHAFDQLKALGAGVARPDLTFGIADHYVPTRARSTGIPDGDIRRMVAGLSANAAAHKIALFGLDDPRQGIVHVVGPEQGLTLPGLLIVCGDSHTSTHGAFGAYAFGIGASEVAHVLMTQTLWQKKPKRMRTRVDGTTGPGIGAKDIALSIIARIGADGAAGHAVEYAGEAVRALSMEGRLTLCNLSIEAGARCGMVAPDEKTIADLRGRPFAPAGEAFERAAADWLALASDADAAFDREVSLDGADIAPVVTWGVSPEDALPIDGVVPDPARAADPGRAEQIRDALAYMNLAPGQRLTDIRVDRVFIGSSTNS
ncbi:MAG: aconitase family protein, partial [Microvirga sp.]